MFMCAYAYDVALCGNTTRNVALCGNTSRNVALCGNTVDVVFGL